MSDISRKLENLYENELRGCVIIKLRCNSVTNTYTSSSEILIRNVFLYPTVESFQLKELFCS